MSNNNQLIRKELVITSPDEAVSTVHVGFFPPKGRYFRKKMDAAGDGHFRTEVLLPPGRSYYHFFFNGCFDKPRNYGQPPISAHDPMRRAPLQLKTEVFCPVQFELLPQYISRIADDLWELRVITHQAWIGLVDLVTPYSTKSFSLAYRHKHIAFWTIRLTYVAAIGFCIRIAGSGQVKYLHAGYRMTDWPEPGAFFFPELGGETTRSGDVSPGTGYQIMPDRFHRYSCEEPAAKFLSWGQEPDLESFFGGNLAGINRKLDYIADMGFTFIYFNPLFRASSYHRYDCVDYFSVDPMLGTEAELKMLVEKAHLLGLKVILDVSLNHCGIAFPAFEDVVRQQEASPYAGWFEIDSFPVSPLDGTGYCGWHGHRNLPQFRLDNPEVQDYFFRVARFWPEHFDIDGWRLDVCTELPEKFVRQFVSESRTVKPGLVIVGESWQNDSRQVAKEYGIDGVTGYGLYSDTLSPFFAGDRGSCSALAAGVMQSWLANDNRTQRFSWNFLSNHDLPRFFSVLREKKDYAAALNLLYALPGSPVLYYGEELMMQGLADPANRGCMEFPLSPGEFPLLPLIRKLNGLRSELGELADYGTLSFPFVCDRRRIVHLQREYGDRIFHLVLNFGEEPFQTILPGGIPCVAGPHDVFIYLS